MAHLYEIDELLATPTLRPGSIRVKQQGGGKADKFQTPPEIIIGGPGAILGGVKSSSEEDEAVETVGPLPIQRKNREVREEGIY